MLFERTAKPKRYTPLYKMVIIYVAAILGKRKPLGLNRFILPFF